MEVRLERVRSRIPANANPFHYYDKAIISIDTLKQNQEFRVWANRSYSDIIVIDEAHNVAFRGAKRSLRARLADLLSRRSDTLIMASATPHDGKAASFASLMNMLNPTAIANPDDYGPEDIKGLFLRRYKKDVQEQLSGSFLERQVSEHRVPASPEESLAYNRLADAEFLAFDRTRRTGELLFKTVLEKALFSSPAACLETIRQRIHKLDKETGPEVVHDRAILDGLAEALERIDREDFSKYGRLIEILRPGGFLQWNPANPADRIVLFTERIETLHFLEQNLARDLGLKPEQIAIVHGSGIEDAELQDIVEDFGRDQSPVRLLLASDIASEGLNLHFLCHKLIHFDIPWSLMVVPAKEWPDRPLRPGKTAAHRVSLHRARPPQG
jgi:SNF2 family DNA or RNA helicase